MTEGTLLHLTMQECCHQLFTVYGCESHFSYRLLHKSTDIFHIDGIIRDIRVWIIFNDILILNIFLNIYRPR